MTVSAVFSDGVSLGPAQCAVIVDYIIDGGAQEEPINSTLLRWSRERGIEALRAGYPLTRIVLSPEPDAQVVVSGRLGFVGLIHGNSIIEERIEGPKLHGFIRDLRVIDTHIYAVGMGRQVYRRSKPGQWEPFDTGLAHFTDNYLDVIGFNAIDGLSSHDIYVAGFDGEIWHFSGDTWRQAATPTNVILERVRAIKPELVFAAGQKGVLLRGHGDAWEIVEHQETDKDFWGIEYFRDNLYLATSEAIFRLLDNDKLERVNLGLTGERTYSQLHSAEGALWSFGPKHLSWTEDGSIWHDVVMG